MTTSIQGFATDISVNVGQRIDFKIDTNASAYTIDIYRIGYYGGDGARKIATVKPSAALPQTQPACITDAATGLYDCGNWAVSASWNVPVHGRVRRLHRAAAPADRNDSSHITFVVRDDSSHSDVVFQTSDTTWQAYNTYGGSNFYHGGANGRAYKVSYNRPVLTRGGPADATSSSPTSTRPCGSWRRTATTSATSRASTPTGRQPADQPQDVPVRRPRRVLERPQRAQRRGGPRRRGQPDVPQRQRGLLADPLRAVRRRQPHAYRTLVCYKETWANAKIDPSDEWTGTWRDPRFAPKPRAPGCRRTA